jgi:hypothetical protein
MNLQCNVTLAYYSACRLESSVGIRRLLEDIIEGAHLVAVVVADLLRHHSEASPGINKDLGAASWARPPR